MWGPANLRTGTWFLSDIASKPFTRAEVRTLLQVADGMVYRRRDRATDPYFYGRMLRVFLTFGAHPSVLPAWHSSTNLATRPTERGDRTYFTWRRAKETEALRPDIEIEVPASYVPWLAAWLDAPKPICRQTYWSLFRELEAEVLLHTGYSIHANPLRARHTCAQQMLERGFTSVDVEAAIGISPSTLRTYGLSTPEQRGEKAEKVGWGNWD